MNIRDYYDFTHELDSQALKSLKSIPGFDKALKAYMAAFVDRVDHMQNMSSNILLSPHQLPSIYNLLPPLCERLEVEEPPLFLKNDPVPNAWTSGNNVPYIVITTACIEQLDKDEIRAVLGHELGHIACGHVLYSAMGRLILSGTASLAGIPLLGDALAAAFFYWMRCSELSADRAAAIAVGDGESVARSDFRLAGTPKGYEDEMSFEAFIAQAESFSEYMSDSNWNTILNLREISYSTHPLTAVRARAIMDWCQQPAFEQVCTAIDNGTVKEFLASAQTSNGTKPYICPICSAVNPISAQKCQLCGTPLGNTVQSLPQTLFCSQCGSRMTAEAQFCSTCGQAIEHPVVPVATPSRPISVAVSSITNSSGLKIKENLKSALNGAQGMAADTVSHLKNRT